MRKRWCYGCLREYLADMVRPCPVNPQYGFMWWLNTDRKLYPSIEP